MKYLIFMMSNFLFALNVSAQSIPSDTKFTISGISSGGFMANQMATIYSSKVKGVGTVAGGFYYCANDYLPKKIEADKNTIGTQDLFLFEPTTKIISDTLNPFVILNGVNPASWIKPSKGNPIYQAVSICMGRPDKAKLTNEYLKANADKNLVDDTANLKDQKVLIFHGKKDSVLDFKMQNKMKAFYKSVGVQDKNINLITGEGSHNFPTDREDGIKCDEESVPYVASCQFNLAEKILKYLVKEDIVKADYNRDHIYLVDQTLDLKNVNQEMKNFTQPVPSVAPYGYLYANDFCLQNSKECELHIALHGCKMSDSYDEDFQTAYQNQVMNFKVVTVKSKKDDPIPHPDLPGNTYKLVNIEDKKNNLELLKFVMDSGYINFAEKNKIMILFPQTWITEKNFPYNPKGCWDWFGYTGENYATNEGSEANWLIKFVDLIKVNPNDHLLKLRPDFDLVLKKFPSKK